MSINQRITKNFVSNILASQRWVELDDDTQIHLMKLCGAKIENKEELYANRGAESMNSEDYKVLMNKESSLHEQNHHLSLQTE